MSKGKDKKAKANKTKGPASVPPYKAAQMVKLQLAEFCVDDSNHNRDGMVLHGSDKGQPVTAFISRRVMDEWAFGGREKSLFRKEYNALGKCNLAAIERIVTTKYKRGVSFNRQHPFVDILLADIIESGEVLITSELVRAPAHPTFQRM